MIEGVGLCHHCGFREPKFKIEKNQFNHNINMTIYCKCGVSVSETIDDSTMMVNGFNKCVQMWNETARTPK